jgi:hypothetical protein
MIGCRIRRSCGSIYWCCIQKLRAGLKGPCRGSRGPLRQVRRWVNQMVDCRKGCTHCGALVTSRYPPLENARPSSRSLYLRWFSGLLSGLAEEGSLSSLSPAVVGVLGVWLGLLAEARPGIRSTLVALTGADLGRLLQRGESHR